MSIDQCELCQRCEMCVHSEDIHVPPVICLFLGINPPASLIGCKLHEGDPHEHEECDEFKTDNTLVNIMDKIIEETVH